MSIKWLAGNPADPPSSSPSSSTRPCSLPIHHLAEQQARQVRQDLESQAAYPLLPPQQPHHRLIRFVVLASGQLLPAGRPGPFALVSSEPSSNQCEPRLVDPTASRCRRLQQNSLQHKRGMEAADTDDRLHLARHLAPQLAPHLAPTPPTPFPSAAEEGDGGQNKVAFKIKEKQQKREEQAEAQEENQKQEQTQEHKRNHKQKQKQKQNKEQQQQKEKEDKGGASPTSSLVLVGPFRRPSALVTVISLSILLLLLIIALHHRHPCLAPMLLSLPSVRIVASLTRPNSLIARFAQVRVVQVQAPFANLRPSSLSCTRTAVTMSPSSEYFVKPPQPPPLFNHTKESIVAEAKAFCDENRALIDSIVAGVKPVDATFENVLLPQIEMTHRQSFTSHILQFYKDVSADEEKRRAAGEVEELFSKTDIELRMRRDVFDLAHALFERRDALGLDPESLRYLEKEHRAYIASGLGLPDGPQRDRFRAISERLSELSTNFSKTLNEENGGLWYTPVQLDGLPGDVMETLEKGKEENEGKVRLTFKYPDYFPAVKFVNDPKVRREIIIAYENKCNENAPIFKEAIVLRDEAARILSYANYAALVIEDKMAKTVKNVDDFLGDLRTRLMPGGKKELAHLKDIKAADLEARGLAAEDTFWLWDFSYYDRILVEKEYQIEENKIAEYFPLSPTVTGMMGIFERLLGLRFFELGPEHKAALSPTGRGEDITWHEDVTMFAVWNDAEAGGEFVGYLYLDMHPRKGKYGHAQNVNLQPGFAWPDGTRHYPATALVCNFSKPTVTKPSLLKHSEVTTMFHELGHGIHDLVGHTRYARFHGTNTVRDFVEAPSQMLENWCWTAAVVKSLSKHWESGEQMPDDLLASLMRTKNVNGALMNLRQLQLGLFDMAMHTPVTHADAEAIEPAAVYNKLRKELRMTTGPEAEGAKPDWSHPEATFGHLMGGYEAGYYGYLYSEVYSTDMFWSIFKKDPMNGSEGRRYRATVLAKGGSRDEMESLVEFLGRKPNNEAFYKDLGIA